MFKQCVVCTRTFSEERFSELKPYKLFRNFFQGSSLDVRICTCGINISVERDPLPMEPLLLETSFIPDRIAVQSNKGGRRQ